MIVPYTPYQEQFSWCSRANDAFKNTQDYECSNNPGTSLHATQSWEMARGITWITDFLQDPPPMTEDMHEERLTAAEALGSSSVSNSCNVLCSPCLK